MKQIEINGKKYDLHFGIDFIREMDKRYEFKGDGVSFGMGLQAAVVYLKDFNSVAIADIIQAATTTQRPLLKNADIEAWIEAQGDNFEKVFDDFLSSLKKSPATKLKVNKVLKEMNL
jgi:phage protein|nr:MAG TPA: tail assembly chaperone [Caudoviricetes sp.]